MALELIIAKRKSGNELFLNKGKAIGTTMLDFWQWAYSDTMGNAERGKIAEFIVAQAVGIQVKNADNLSDPWGKFDLLSPQNIKIEVKASGYIQSWAQEYESKLIFGIGETFGWDALSSKFEEEKKRQSDVYVFCVFKHKSYLMKDKYNVSMCDIELYFYLKNTVNNALEEGLSVHLIENSDLLKGVNFYNNTLDINIDWKKRQDDRQNWFNNSVSELFDCDVIFCDPDNGFEVSSVKPAENKAGKYIFFEEINTLLGIGKSVIIYHHGNKRYLKLSENEYAQQIFSKIKKNLSTDVTLVCLHWQTIAERFYFWIIREEHKEKLLKSINELTSSEWGKHFRRID